ncbi:MAG TPA: hypothetical protein VJM84_04315 [Actinomycetota bacterium]|nr:hypothetical protein [Actinomycetota bacterium]
MRIIDRFTRDEVSAKIWWPLTLLCLVALVLTIPGSNRAVERVRTDTAAEAAAFSADVLQPLIAGGAAVDELTVVAQQRVASDPRLSAVRIWGTDHRLVVSSSRTEQVGSGEALNDGDIDAAVEQGSLWVVTDRSATGDQGPTTYYAYTSIPVTGGTLVTQFEAVDATLLADVHRDWMWYRITLAATLLLFLALAALSMREPIAPIGAKVPFYPTSVPRWLEVMDVDRAVALEQAGDRAKDRVAGLQQRLEESERLRLKAEGQLQQALTSLSAAGRPAPGPVAMPSPIAPAVGRHAKRPTPEAATAAVAAVEETKKRKPAKPAAAAKRAPAIEEPPVVEPITADVSISMEATPLPEPPAEPAPLIEPVAIIDEDIEIVATSELEHDVGGWPEVVVHPDPELARVPASAHGSTFVESDQGSARDVLNRLVPPVPAADPAADPSEMRARLARTAALKKPGSKERQEEREGLQD